MRDSTQGGQGAFGTLHALIGGHPGIDQWQFDIGEVARATG
jgi:hypothetical protein